jgi:hypothetical protein
MTPEETRERFLYRDGSCSSSQARRESPSMPARKAARA